MLIGFLLILFGLAVGFWIVPDRSFSAEENRSLATLPSFSGDRLLSGAYGEDWNDYYADQFPMRDFWVGQKGIAELLLGRGENDGILLGDNGQLARRLFDVKCADGSVLDDTDTFDRAHVKKSVEGINRLASTLDIPFSLLLTGRTVDIAGSSFSYPSAPSEELLKTIQHGLSSDVQTIETVPMLRECYENGEYVYYKTDHHWTTRGAYYAYCEVMRTFGMENEIIPEDCFTKETVSERFFGTLWSAGGMKFVEPDTVEIWHADNENAFEILADGRPLDGFYSMEKLDGKDHYSVFLDGVHDVVTVRKTDEADRPVLLLLKDSFANSLSPFLAQHFDLVLLNLSSSKNDYTDVTYYAQKYGADRLMLVYTVENIITADKLTRLK